MPVSDIEILDHAQALSMDESEVSWRTSASEAYYAVFHRASLMGDAPVAAGQGKTGEHQKLIERIKHCGPLGNELATRMSKLKRRRVRADYEISAFFTKQDAKAQLKLAREVMEETSRFMKAFHSSRIAEASKPRKRTR